MRVARARTTSPWNRDEQDRVDPDDAVDRTSRHAHRDRDRDRRISRIRVPTLRTSSARAAPGRAVDPSGDPPAQARPNVRR
ncbi:hypothetical protein DMP17_23420 [Pseudonocardia sp. TMWB2A]